VRRSHARRRRHQARQGHLWRGRAGRDGAQDGRGHGARHPGPRHQARRPAAQRADLAYVSAEICPPQGQGDPRDLRPAGPPAGDEHHQVGTRGPVLPDALPQGVRRDRPARGRAGAGTRGVPRPGARPGPGRPQGRQDQGDRHRPPEALLLRVPEDGRRGPRLRPDLRPGGRAGARRDRARLLCRLGALHARWKPVPGRFKDYIAMPKFNMYQSLHTTVIGPQGKPVEIQIRTHTCTAGPSTASPPTGSTRRARRQGWAAQFGAGQGPRGGPDDQRHGWLRQLLDWQKETSDPGEFLESCASRSTPARSTSSRPRGSSSACPRGRLRSTSPTPCTPRSATTASGPGSTAASCRWRDPRQRRRRRGADLQGRERGALAGLAALRQVAPTSPQQDQAVVHPSAARRWSTRQGRRSPRRCASRACPCSADDLVESSPASPRSCACRHRRSVCRHRRGTRLGPARRQPAHGARSGARRVASEDLAESTTPGRWRAAAPEHRPGRRRQGHRTCGSSWRAAAPRCRGTTILGFVTRGSGVSVHRRDCTNAESLLSQKEKIIDVEWAPTAGSIFLVQLRSTRSTGRGCSPMSRGVLSDTG
jgi:hypothetical protein